MGHLCPDLDLPVLGVAVRTVVGLVVAVVVGVMAGSFFGCSGSGANGADG